MVQLKIRILDWETVSGGDLSYDRFEKYGEIKAYGMTSPKEASERIGDAEIVLCNKTPMTAEVINACSNLKYIGLFATGYNNVDLKAANEKNITVCNSPAYSTDAVAQHTFALIMQFYNRVSEYNNSVKNGNWVKSKTFSYFSYNVSELAGKIISIIGYGSIGKKVAKIAEAFGMNVIFSTRTVPKESKYKFVSTDEAFRLADILTIHCPLTEQTKGMVCKEKLDLMKKSALLINTARGDIVNEKDLADALNNEKIAGAGLDVLSAEPMSENTPLKNAKNCIITPHIGWAPIETRKRLLEIVENNLKAFLDGNPINKINNKI